MPLHVGPIERAALPHHNCFHIEQVSWPECEELQDDEILGRTCPQPAPRAKSNRLDRSVISSSNGNPPSAISMGVPFGAVSTSTRFRCAKATASATRPR